MLCSQNSDSDYAILVAMPTILEDLNSVSKKLELDSNVNNSELVELSNNNAHLCLVFQIGQFY